ncbi:MAG: hypothetical protein LBS92_02690 [Candidatus Methanoplasma sp.]|jgi:hypothetical protein|nr:hypothetical protein [Candidatus Methanoplasma sp.]
MKNTKMLAVAAVAILAVAAIGAFALAQGGEEEKKGLYRLNADVSLVDMGRCSATPGVIMTIEQIYKDYYGDIGHDGLTLDDAKGDAEFWSQYGSWDSIVTKEEDGTLSLLISSAAKGPETVNMPVADNVVVMGTMYSETIYFLACAANNVAPYSEESFKNEAVMGYIGSVVAGGMDYTYYEEYDTRFLLDAVDKSTYADLKVNSVQRIDPELLTTVLNKVSDNGSKNTVYLASGTRISSAEHYSNNTAPATRAGVHYAFFAPSTISDVFQSIECIGAIMGFDDVTIDKVVQDIQLRLYKVHKAVEDSNKGKEPAKAYWEGSSGTAVSSAMATVILDYLGFDASLLDGAEHDMESLLSEKPKLILFYTNDGRSDAEKMRTDT